MRRRLLIASVVALVLGALAAPSVLAGNDYSDQAYTQHDLDTVATELNDRPRQTLGWHTPFQEMTKLLVAAAS